MSTDKRSLKNKNWRHIVLDDIDQEGFDYAFDGYENYKWVNDVRFQELKNKYLQAKEDLRNYIGVNDD